MSELLFSLVSELKGTPPDVPFAPGVDVDGLRADDPDPMFLTLPIVTVGGKSGNGFTWGQEDVENVVREINAKKPEGIEGHIALSERSTKYVLPKVRWLGAALVGGQAWAKGYIPRSAADTREYLRIAKRTGARVGTSVYGLRGERGLSDMNLESIDFGHPDRLGSPSAAAVPVLTSEMQHENNHNEESIMPTEGELKLVSELTSEKDTAMRQVSKLITEVSDQKQLVAEMKKRNDEMDKIDQLVAEFVGDNPHMKVQSLVSEVKSLRAAARKEQQKAWVEAAVKDIELEEVRELVSEQVGDVTSEADAKRVVAEVLQRPTIQKIKDALALKAAGGRAAVGNRSNPESLNDLDKPETIAEARQRLGF